MWTFIRHVQTPNISPKSNPQTLYHGVVLPGHLTNVSHSSRFAACITSSEDVTPIVLDRVIPRWAAPSSGPASLNPSNCHTVVLSLDSPWLSLPCYGEFTFLFRCSEQFLPPVTPSLVNMTGYRCKRALTECGVYRALGWELCTYEFIETLQHRQRQETYFMWCSQGQVEKGF